MNLSSLPTAPGLAGDAPRPSRAFVVVYSGRGMHVVEVPARSEVVVGRSPEADVTIDDLRVSRRHAAFRFDGLALSLQDLGSRNGTTLNGRTFTGPALLRTGDEVLAGGALFVVGMTAGPRHRKELLPWPEISAHLAVAVRHARDGGQALAFVLVHLPEPASAEALLGAFPDGTLAGRYAPGLVALCLSAPTAADARRAVDGALRRHGAAVESSVVVAPDDAADTERILEMARRGLAGAGANAAAAIDESSFVARDPSTRALVDLVRRVAAHDTTVLLFGETGTGKEVFAREIHRRSPRSAGPFVAINCGAIPETLVEATLFGHMRGAFTGALESRVGMFHAAARGSIFLDEVSELRPQAQTALLRVLERREVTRVGDTRPEPVDVRVLAATNVDLEEAVSRGIFRRDLLYRLNAFVIQVPPLRDRPGDLDALIDSVLAGRRIAEEARKALSSYAWPGNVRELLNVLERAVVLAGSGAVTEEHLPPRLCGGTSEGRNLRARMLEAEVDVIRDALEASGGKRALAAKLLGVSRRTLMYKLKKLGIGAVRGRGPG